MPDVSSLDADLAGAISPPRDNGELVFAAPWERRVFGLTVSLCQSQALEWESFRRQLIARISADDEAPYWESWTVALEDVLAESDTIQPAELDARHLVLLARPAGHDHHH